MLYLGIMVAFYPLIRLLRERAAARLQSIALISWTLLLSVMAFVIDFRQGTHGDLSLYYETTRALLDGVVPYRDRTFEYPPYSFVWLILPSLAPTSHGFRVVFALQVLAMDLIVKILLIKEGRDDTSGCRSLIPILSYSIALPFLSYFYFQRLDLLAAGSTFVGVILFCKRRPFVSALWLSLAAGTKLYPILLLVSMLCLSKTNRGQARGFLIGIICGMSPLIAMSWAVPWWRFISFHIERGIEVESLWASSLWMWHFFFPLEIEWIWVRAWHEVTGSSATMLATLGRPVCISAVGVSLLTLCRSTRASELCPMLSLPETSKLMLFAILPFVGFNNVLSPQYMLWFLPLAAMGSASSKGKILLLLPVLAMLTPLWYPSPHFSSGFTLFQTFVVLTRNVLLVLLWVKLLLGLSARVHPTGSVNARPGCAPIGTDSGRKPPSAGSTPDVGKTFIRSSDA